MDIGADIAEHIFLLKSLQTSQNYDESQYSYIKTQVTATLEHLNSWWQEWEPEHRQSAWEVPTRETLFSTLLEYDTLWTAFTVLVYDMMRILLLQLTRRLGSVLGDPSSQPSYQAIADIPKKTILLGISSDTQALAREILRSLTYCYEKSPQLVGTFSFLFIQDVAYGCFCPHSKEGQWIVDHGWAKSSRFSDAEDVNLLKRLLPLGQVRLYKE